MLTVLEKSANFGDRINIVLAAQTLGGSEPGHFVVT